MTPNTQAMQRLLDDVVALEKPLNRWIKRADVIALIRAVMAGDR